MSNSGGGGGTIIRPPMPEDRATGTACALCGTADDATLIRVGLSMEGEVKACSDRDPDGALTGCFPLNERQEKRLRDWGVTLDETDPATDAEATAELVTA